MPAGVYLEQRGKKCLMFWLFSVGQARHKRHLSLLQQEALAQAREARKAAHTCSRCQRWFRDKSTLNTLQRCGHCEGAVWRRNTAIRWAEAVLADPRTLILDTETTSLAGYICSLALVRPDGAVVFNALINPEEHISEEATRVNGLHDADVAAAPTLAEFWPQLEPLLQAGRIIAYNSRFDAERLVQSASRFGADGWIEAEDLMQRYADYRQSGWWKLEQAARREGVKPGEHHALGDCLAALGVMQAIAHADLLPEVERAEIVYEDGIPF
jgi:DNA polymerase III epsilon subunit-like protein